MSGPEQAPVPDRMADGIGYAYAFQIFNSFSYSIVIGTPLLLYFKKLGATASILGLVTALPAFLTILNLPAAAYVEKAGYRAFVLKGWTLRSLFILVMAGVVFLPQSSVGIALRMALMLGCLLCYSISRGFYGCGYVPWLSRLIPPGLLGQFIWRDQVSSNLAIIGSAALTGGYLLHHEGVRGFGVVFLVSFTSAMISLSFLKRIPDATVPHAAKSGQPVPWLELLRYRPFQFLLFFNAVMLTGWAGSGVFFVPFLRDTFGLSDAGFLLMVVLTGAVFIVSMGLFGRVIDRVGSKPLLTLSLAFQVLHFSGWGLVAARIIPFCWASVLLQVTTFGVANALFQLANTRLGMAIVPSMGRSHFFAILSVVPNVVLGLMPVVWGLLVDGLQGWQKCSGGWHWNVYSLFYLLVAGIVALSYLFLYRVEEKSAMNTDTFIREFFLKTPARVWARLSTRRTTP